MRKIIHADCDCFYAAVEMRDFPELADKPIAVGGDADRRGVIATCNYPARAFGVRSAMPTGQALKLCPQLILRKGRMEEYRATAARIREVFYQLTDQVEVVSIDEAYLDVTEVEAFQGSATRMAQWLKAEVLRRTGVTLSVGISSNKFLAKVASDWQKPDGLFVIRPDQISAFIPDLPVARIHGVGRVTAEKLKQSGIETCAQLQACTVTELTERFGKFGITLYQRARGEDYREVVTERVRKSVSVERTFPRNLNDRAQILQALEQLFPVLERRYRGYESRSIRSLFAKVRFADFSVTTAEHSYSAQSADQLPGGAAFTPALFEPLLEEALQRGPLDIRLLGIGIRLRDPAVQGEQLKLF